jgi:peptide deformylase
VAILKIRTIPDPVLKETSKPVTSITTDIITLADDMVATMHHFPRCTGIAAPQVGRSVRLVVADASLTAKPCDNHGLLIMINPAITARAGSVSGREGCLSIPDFTANVTRAATVTVQFTDEGGQQHTFTTNGFEAVLLQHEIDHLDGYLFLDRVTSLKTDVFRRKK